MATIPLLEGSDLITAAKNIRKELKAAFPGVVFSVKSERFSMGNAVDVYWIDGPTEPQVREITDKYRGGDFDGMTDSYNPNTGAARAWTDRHGSAKYVHVHRRNTDAQVQRAIDAVGDKYGATTRPTVEEYHTGNLIATSPIQNAPTFSDASWQALIRRDLYETAA